MRLTKLVCTQCSRIHLGVRYPFTCICGKSYERPTERLDRLRQSVRSNPQTDRRTEIQQRKDLKAMIPVPGRQAARNRIRSEMKDVSILTEQELARDSIILAGKILAKWPDCDGVAGVPRSGMIAASLIATNLGVPLYECSKGILEAMGGGRRMRRAQRTTQSKIVVIEDSVNTGWAMKQAIGSQRDPRIIGTATVYCTPTGESEVDLFAIPLPLPHWFTWHMFGSNLLSRTPTGFDFDGILGHDSTAEEDDDGERYLQWLEYVKPLYLYRGGSIHCIITGRLEKYRPQTEAWLAKYGQKYDKLVMGPWESKRERSRHRVGQWKGEMIKELGLQLYVESDPRQAIDIFNTSKVPVICPAARKVFA